MPAVKGYLRNLGLRFNSEDYKQVVRIPRIIRQREEPVTKEMIVQYLDVDVGACRMSKEDFCEQIATILNNPAKERKHWLKEISEYLNIKYCIALNSGTDALVLGLHLLGVKKGDEVIIPAHTYCATAIPFARTGARVVWADIDPITYNVTPDSMRAAANDCNSLKAILPVHLYGQTVDMDGILAVSRLPRRCWPSLGHLR